MRAALLCLWLAAHLFICLATNFARPRHPTAHLCAPDLRPPSVNPPSPIPPAACGAAHVLFTFFPIPYRLRLHRQHLATRSLSRPVLAFHRAEDDCSVATISPLRAFASALARPSTALPQRARLSLAAGTPSNPYTLPSITTCPSSFLTRSSLGYSTCRKPRPLPASQSLAPAAAWRQALRAKHTMDSDSDAYDVYDGGSDAFEPSPAPKKTTKAAATKTAAATKAKNGIAAAKPKKKLLAKRDSNGDSEPDVTMADTDAEVSFQALPATIKPANGKSASETYQKLSQLEHVLKRPDTYIGSVEKHTEPLWVYDAEKKQMAYRETTYVPGFYKIFDEILVNAADNKVRDPSMDTLKVTIDREEGTISVWNNGAGVPIEMHAKEKVYIPELIFGNLLTSSNYDDDEAKVTGGRNGYGAKLANIYSTEFTVETADKRSGQKYKQVFSDNMHTKGKPKILKNTKKEEFTCITFKPDLKRFGMESMDGDIEGLMMKRVYDMAGTVKDIKVILNGERLKVKNFKQYVEMYVAAINELSDGPKMEEPDAAGGKPKQSIIYESVTDKGRTWEVAFAVSDGQFRQVSFVNNIATIKGGKHVDHVADQVVNRLIDHVKKDKKNGPVKPHQVRQQLWVFVNCQIVNPTFDGQTKETLTLKQSAFGSKWTLTDDFAKKILKSGVVDNILSFAKFKQDQAMKKTDGHKRTRITGIAKLEDANNAGTKKGGDCTLILTEGDSAKALAVQGLSEIGRDNFGVFPLRGKMLNVRDASHDQIMKNAEIKAIKEILGLQHGKQYTDTNSLRYGSIMIMADQDHDGSHIKGLLINFFDHFYPSLLRLPNFLVEFITPIIKCTHKKNSKRQISFFTLPEYHRWKEENNNGADWRIKYYKGLGTSESKDAKEYFGNMPKHRIPFDTTKPGDRELIDLAFNKKKADDRKEWLRQFRPGTYLDYNIDKLPLADFINKELILFSMADNIRSIPSMVDGFKPGQRKILYACYKRNLRNEIKVQQLGGYVSEHTAYHHGEASLYMTITGLAQDFVGSNNVNLLMPNGQFGTRAAGGKDAASARYIFTNVPSITRALYHPADEKLLNYLDDDGQSIEPEWYIPVVPQVLLNGSEGIGTGWSSSVPNYNPTDIVANLRRRMAGEEMVPMIPWYRGFTGTIEPVAADKFKVSGIVTKIDDKTYEITELPIRVWTDNYKAVLEERVAGTDKVPATVREYREYHTERSVHFVVELNAKGQQEIVEKGEDAFFKLSNQISTSNMVLFDSDGKIKKYATPEEILEDFYMIRLSYYQKRKDHLIDTLKNQYERLSNQARFIQMIISRELIVSNRKKADIVTDLRKKDFKPIPKTGKPKVAAEGDDAEGDDAAAEEEVGPDSDYDYLLTMQIYNLTKEKVEKLLRERDVKEDEIKVLLGRTPQNLWGEDLHRFEEEWEKLLAEDEVRHAKKTTMGIGNGKKGKLAVAAAKSKKVTKQGAAARKVLKKSEDSDDEDEVMASEGDDSEDDFKPAAKTAAARKKAATTTKTRKPSPRKRTAASATLDDDDLAAIGAAPSSSVTASSSKADSVSPPVSKKAKAETTSPPLFLDGSGGEDDNDNDEKMAPIFRKPSTSTAAKSTASKARSASGSKAKPKAEPAKVYSLSDSDEELVIPTKTKAAPAKKAVAKKPAATTKVAAKKKAKQESDSEGDFTAQDSVAIGDDSVASVPPKRSGRGATRKASYKIESEDDDEDEDY
ncbi:DNA topoisomerase 2 [Thecaphora frezii]